MVTTHDALAVWEKVMAAKQGSTPLRRGTIGDGAGNVEVEGLPGWVWIRYDDEQNRLSQVRCPLGYLDHDTRVLSGKWHPDDDYEQVLSINWGPYSWDMRDSTFAGYKLPQHGDTHHGTYGTDPAYIDYNNITIGRVLATDPASLTVAIESFVYPYGMETLDYDGGTIDLTAHVPAGAGHRYVLIYFDLDTQAPAVIAGDIAPDPAPPSIPALTTNGIPLAVVELYNGQPEIVYDNIWQRKLMLGSVGGTVTPHTHTTDASGGSSLIGIQELMLNCATALPVIGGQIWPTDVYHELYVQDTGLYMHDGTLEADLVRINADLAWGCGQLLIIRPTEPGLYTDYRITVRHGVGNIRLNGRVDITIDERSDHILLIYDGEYWSDFCWWPGGRTRAISSDYAATLVDHTLLVTCSIANITITLPAAVTRRDNVYIVKKLDATAFTVIVDGDGAELIDDAATQTLIAQYDSMQIQCDGTGWWIL